MGKNKMAEYGSIIKAVSLLFIFMPFFIGNSINAFAKESCVTDKCHSDKGKDKFVHGPVAVGECLACHKKTGEHKFAPMKKENEEQLCYKCHPDKINKTKGTHKQVRDSYCSRCHDPHQSPNKYQLKPKSL